MYPIIFASVILIASAQAPRSTSAPLDLVEVVGCLTNDRDDTWVVINASQPVVSKAPWTTADAVRAADARPLGTGRFRLIGVSAFKPATRRGHKVAVKGVLIKDAAEMRINVTSLQTASETCTK